MNHEILHREIFDALLELFRAIKITKFLRHRLSLNFRVQLF